MSAPVTFGGHPLRAGVDLCASPAEFRHPAIVTPLGAVPRHCDLSDLCVWRERLGQFSVRSGRKRLWAKPRSGHTGRGHVAGSALGPDPADPRGDDADLDPSADWVPPRPNIDLQLSSGPILTTFSYRIRQDDITLFRNAMREKRRNRLRDGAVGWILSRDILDSMVWFERFEVVNWAAAQRMHSRRTHAGAHAIETLRGMHQGSGRPEVHYERVSDPRDADSAPDVFPVMHGRPRRGCLTSAASALPALVDDLCLGCGT